MTGLAGALRPSQHYQDHIEPIVKLFVLTWPQ